VWLLGPAGFPEGSGEKSISSSSRTLAKIERPVNRTPARLPPVEDCSARGDELP
jgi:hypothetical protein